IFAANRAGDKFLNPGIVACFGNRPAQAKPTCDKGDKQRGSLLTKLHHHPGNEQQQRRHKLARPPEDDIGALVSKTSDCRGNKWRDNAHEGEQRQQKTNLRIADGKLTQKQDKDRAKKGELREHGIGSVGGDAPGKTAHFLGGGWFSRLCDCCHVTNSSCASSRSSLFSILPESL